MPNPMNGAETEEAYVPLYPASAPATPASVLERIQEVNEPNNASHDEAVHLSRTKASPVSRPTFVPIPKLTFVAEPHPSSYSNRSISPSVLVEFDKNPTRASRNVSKPAVSIEPGLPVLVVDDDQLTRKILQRLLRLQGCRVSLAENGEVALRSILGLERSPMETPASDSEHFLPILERKQPGVVVGENGHEEKYGIIFLDNQMPVLSGVGMVQQLRAMGRKDFVVGVTGLCALSVVLGCADDRNRQCAFVRYVVDPVVCGFVLTVRMADRPRGISGGWR